MAACGKAEAEMLLCRIYVCGKARGRSNAALAELLQEMQSAWPALCWATSHGTWAGKQPPTDWTKQLFLEVTRVRICWLSKTGLIFPSIHGMKYTVYLTCFPVCSQSTCAIHSSPLPFPTAEQLWLPPGEGFVLVGPCSRPLPISSVLLAASPQPHTMPAPLSGSKTLEMALQSRRPFLLIS